MTVRDEVFIILSSWLKKRVACLYRGNKYKGWVEEDWHRFIGW